MSAKLYDFFLSPAHRAKRHELSAYHFYSTPHTTDLHVCHITQKDIED
jgi:hypothetical protein